MTNFEFDFELIPGRLEQFWPIFQECTPKVLVVTDGSLNGGAGGFGLSHFIDVLEATDVHGMNPIVTHRDRGVGDTAFDDLTINNFDVLFLFGINSEASTLTATAHDNIVEFMQAGGGVFATGDHEDLGAGMSGDLPRVRAMRFWASTETPDIADPSRLTTNLPGPDGVYVFDDQADEFPQRLYPNYAVGTDGLILLPFPPNPVKLPHPLLRLSGGDTLHVYPDHPHEGECRIPTDLNTTFDHDGNTLSEWPSGQLGSFFFPRPRPRAVAYAMSAGNGFSDFVEKSAVEPRSFITIAAYDGHVADVGRVVTDATWHHYVNVNLGGMRPGGVSNADMQAIEEFWGNLVNWLMPENVRMCLFPWLVARVLVAHPILEELRIPERDSFEIDELELLGRQVLGAVESIGGVGSDVLTAVGRRLAGRSDGRETNGAAKRHKSEIDPAVADLLAEASHVVVGLIARDVAHGLDAGKVDHDHKLLDRVVDEYGRGVIGEVSERRLAEVKRQAASLRRTVKQLEAATN